MILCMIRWDESYLDKLPDYMKVFYKLLLNTFAEFEKELMEQGKAYSVKYGREAVIYFSHFLLTLYILYRYYILVIATTNWIENQT